ncbi:MAG: MBL fold metallo-hydrolase [Clostridiales Family XIII bacterium]|jgi:glyoxylase-like metal-dependent hydrolase (beta-lactamase superfamily II)|nr:MBL fold metallo-hydrolase [Clostridiales Family XIII bacterium]
MNTDIKRFTLDCTQCYLLKAEDGYLLIDTGLRWTEKYFDRRLQKTGIDVDDIKTLFLTHCHDDHCGLLQYVVGRNPKIRVILHEIAAERLRSGHNYFVPESGIPSKGGVLLSRTLRVVSKQDGAFPPYDIREKDIVIRGDDDEILRGLGVDGTIIRTPGHTADSISILLDDGSCFAGDAAMSSWYALLAGCKYLTISIANLEEFYASWGKILANGAKTIYPSHGSPFRADILRKYGGRIKRLEPKFKRALEEEDLS